MSSIAVIGTGISGMSAAWLLSQRHRITVFERAERLGGHSNTVEVATPAGGLPIDTGFIVYNEVTYPNLTALFGHLGVPTIASEMTFAVSLDGGRLEYNGTSLGGVFAQPRNLVSPRFWSMLRDLNRFYAHAPAHAADLGLMSLGDYLARENYGAAFRDDHLLPMAAAIWSAPAQTLLDYPAQSFIRFCENHGLLKLTGRPIWRTVRGGSRVYIQKLMEPLQGNIRLNCQIQAIHRTPQGVCLQDVSGATHDFDHVVVATPADQALRMLAEPTEDERDLLAAFRYSRNLAVLHTDEALMPRRRKVWASWNYLGRSAPQDDLCVTYWMNRLQALEGADHFVTLNPPRPPRAGTLLHSEVYHHPVFDVGALKAQRQLWRLQGRQNTWFCGAHFGAGFHEDGLQAGLAVAEALGGGRRPWRVPNESGRITLEADASTVLQ